MSQVQSIVPPVEVTIEAFRQTVRGEFRTATAGDHYRIIEIAKPGELPGARGWSEQGEKYKRTWYRKTDSHHTYRIPADWVGSVQSRDLAMIDGMITIFAGESQETCVGKSTEPFWGEVIPAKWVAQGKGFSLDVSTGWIARRGNATYHSTRSAKDALAKLRRKIIADRLSRQYAAIRDRLATGDCMHLCGLVVTFGDSIRAGNCDSGTRSWIARHMPGRESATVRELLDADGKNSDVLRACMAAIRRNRRTAVAA